MTLDPITPTIAPHNLDAEASVLGAILLDTSALAAARELITEHDFYQTKHQTIFRAMLELAERGEVIDQLGLTDYLKGRNELEAVGGATYLAGLDSTVGSAANIRRDAGVVAKEARRREIHQHLLLVTHADRNGGATQKQLEALSDAITQNSIAAQKTDPSHRSNFHPTPADQLLAEPPEEVDWVLEDYLPAGGLVLLAGKPKEGKTTLTYELAVRVVLGQPFLGRQTRQGAVLILALEEHKREVKMRLRDLGADEISTLHVNVGPLDPTATMLNSISRYAREHEVILILIDTLSALWEIENENDAAEVTKAIKPILALARESEACVLLIHHARKSEGSHGDEIRGSGALFAALDVALILKRHTVETQRILQAQSRFQETPAELVLELRESGYVALGDPASMSKAARLEKLAACLTDQWQTTKQLAKQAGYGRRDTSNLLGRLVRDGKAEQRGAGHKHDPHQFRQADSVLAPLKKGGAPDTKHDLLLSDQGVRPNSYLATPRSLGETRNQKQIPDGQFVSGEGDGGRQQRNDEPAGMAKPNGSAGPTAIAQPPTGPREVIDL